MASADAHTATVIAQPTEPHAASVADQITGPSNVGAPGGGAVQLVAHHPREGHRIDRDAPVVTSHQKAKDKEEEETSSRDLLPKGQAVAVAEEESPPNALTVTGLSGSQHPPKVDNPEGDETKEFVSINADLPGPAHPPKVSGEQFYNTFRV